MNEPSYYANIPAPVRYCKEITPNAKLLYGEITALASKYGYAFASNKYFAELYDVNNETVSRWISSLVDRGFLRVDIDADNGYQRRIYLGIIAPDTLAKKRKGVDKKRNPPCEKTQPPLDEKRNHNNTFKNTSSRDTPDVTTSSANIEISSTIAGFDPVGILLDTFPEVSFFPAQLGSIVSEVKDCDRDREAWRLTIEKYKLNFNPMTKSYVPSKVGNLIEVYRAIRDRIPEKKEAPGWQDELNSQAEICKPVYVG